MEGSGPARVDGADRGRLACWSLGCLGGGLALGRMSGSTNTPICRHRAVAATSSTGQSTDASCPSSTTEPRTSGSAWIPARYPSSHSFLYLRVHCRRVLVESALAHMLPTVLFFAHRLFVRAPESAGAAPARQTGSHARGVRQKQVCVSICHDGVRSEENAG
eukprot:2013312-Rhodomonas_salina.5